MGNQPDWIVQISTSGTNRVTGKDGWKNYSFMQDSLKTTFSKGKGYYKINGEKKQMYFGFYSHLKKTNFRN